MWSKSSAALALSQILSVPVLAQWPSSYDEIEDLMVVQGGSFGRGFANAVTPCSNAASEGFLNSASFIRTAFHDAAAYDSASGTGGMDGSIGYELHGDFLVHNTGPGFGAILAYVSAFYSEKASIADLLALGVYTSVRSCGGPQIPMRAGRVDATGAGPNALPDAADSISTLQGRFAKMGLTNAEMIALTACGHTIGGVHAQINTKIAQGAQQAKASGQKPPKPNRFRRQDGNTLLLPFDKSQDKFDNLNVVEYLDGTSENPLIAGNETLASDLHVYKSDNTGLLQSFRNNDLMMGACQDVLQKMIELVPKNVQLSDIIKTYVVKPSQLNLNVDDNGSSVVLSGRIRVRTNNLDASHVQVVVKDHSGNVCDSCTADATPIGDAAGFDDQFQAASISSFNVVVGGQVFSNGGNGFPVNDNAFVQASSSSNGKIVVAVRAGQQGTPEVSVSSKSGFQIDSLPSISKNSLSVSQICADSSWTYYSATGNIDTAGTIDVSQGGKVVDGFRKFNFPDTAANVVCGTATTTTTSTTTSTTTESTTVSTTETTTTTESTTTTTSATTADATSTTSSSTSSSTGSTSTSSGSTSTSTGSVSTSTSSSSSSSTTTTSNTKDGISTTTSKGSTLTTTTSKTSGTTKSGLTTSTTKDGKPTSKNTSWAPPPAWTVYDPPKKTTTKAWSVVTVSKLTTWCPYPTTLVQNGKTYTVTKATTLIITDCPCTSTVVPTGANGKPSNGAYPTYGYGGDNNADKGGAALSSAFQIDWNKPAPSGGSDGGDKNAEGLKQYVIITVTPTYVAATTIAPQGTGAPWTGANVATTPVSPKETGWTPVSNGPSSTWAATPVATFKGAANTVAVRDQVLAMGVAAIVGAVAMIM